MNQNAPLADWLRLHFAYLTLAQLQTVLAHFGDLGQALAADADEWGQHIGLKPKQRQALFHPDEAEIEQALRWAEAENQHIIPWGDKAYPELLRETEDAPILLYARGKVDLLKAPQLAVVGSRHASRQGLQIAEDFATHLSAVGLCITSGLAHGIDAAAHRGGLKGQGSTLAVVGTGLDRIYPAANQALAREISERGLMVSEYALGTRPLAYHFPRRNRIISGLATGCLVVEAALKSGSLITARQAMEQGREVFAIPGSINNSLAKGCHQLIKQGAKLVETAEDILEELSPLVNFTWQAQQATQSIVKDEVAGLLNHPLLALMGFDAISLDELAVLSKLPASEIQVQMMLLELEGVIEALSAGRWRRLA
jgi:DNA processing protein